MDFDFSVVTSNQLFAVLFSIHAIAAFIVNLTPTPTDDAIVSKAYRAIEFAAGIFTSKAKQ